VRAVWRLPEVGLTKRELNELAGEGDAVLVEFEGPQIVSIKTPEGGRRLAVACDEDAEAVRWASTELSGAAWGELFAGTLPIRDALLGGALVLVDVTRSGELLRGWKVSSGEVDTWALPEAGALLPVETRHRFAGAPGVAPAELAEKDAAVALGFPHLPRAVAA
jgi:hypothetical protein